MSDKTKSEARNPVKRESDLFNPLISINYRGRLLEAWLALTFG